MKHQILALLLAVAASSLSQAADKDVPIITQNGQTVTLADINAFMMRIPPDRRAGFIESPDRVTKMITDTLRNTQLAKLALEQKLDQDPAVQAQIAFGTNEALAQAYLNAFDSTLKIPSMEAAAREEYQVNKSKYTSPAKLEVQNVLIAPSPTRPEVETKALADKVRAEAEANPAAFDQLVEKYSEDPTKAQNKGVIEDGTSSKLVPQFVAAVKALHRPNEISPVVQTQYGYHIIRLIKRNPGKQLAFDEVKKDIEDKLRAHYIEEQRRISLSKLDNGKVTVNPDLRKILQERYNPAGLSPADEQSAKAAKP